MWIKTDFNTNISIKLSPGIWIFMIKIILVEGKIILSCISIIVVELKYYMKDESFLLKIDWKAKITKSPKTSSNDCNNKTVFQFIYESKLRKIFLENTCLMCSVGTISFTQTNQQTIFFSFFIYAICFWQFQRIHCHEQIIHRAEISSTKREKNTHFYDFIITMKMFVENTFRWRAINTTLTKYPEYKRYYSIGYS